MLPWFYIPRVLIWALTRSWHHSHSSYLLNSTFISMNFWLLPLGLCMLTLNSGVHHGKESYSQPTHCALACAPWRLNKPDQIWMNLSQNMFQEFTLCCSAADGFFIHSLLPRAEEKPLQCVWVDLKFPAPFCSTYLCPFELLANIGTSFSFQICN